MRALAWEFPNDPQLAAVETQFLLGPSLLITPVLEPLVSTVKGVFPGIADGEVWYDWYTSTKVIAQAGVNTTIDAPLGHIPVFVRGGSVLPLQEPGYTTAESRKNPWGLIIALNADGEAEGQLYIDDGESLEPDDSLYITFKVQDGSLEAKVEGGYKDTNALGSITIMGVKSAGSVSLNGLKVDQAAVSFDQANGILKFKLNELTSGGAWQGDWTLNWD